MNTRQCHQVFVLKHQLLAKIQWKSVRVQGCRGHCRCHFGAFVSHFKRLAELIGISLEGVGSTQTNGNPRPSRMLYCRGTPEGNHVSRGRMQLFNESEWPGECATFRPIEFIANRAVRAPCIKCTCSFQRRCVMKSQADEAQTG